MLKQSNLYTFAEVYLLMVGEPYTLGFNHGNPASMFSLQPAILTYNATLPTWATTYRDELCELMCRFALNSQQDDVYFLETDKEFTVNNIRPKWIAFWETIQHTIDHYVPLIRNLKTSIANAFVAPEASTTTVSRFNDTPQNSGDFNDDQHTSTITTNETSSTLPITLAEQLDAAADALNDYYDEWIKELRGFMIYEW